MLWLLAGCFRREGAGNGLASSLAAEIENLNRANDKPPYCRRLIQFTGKAGIGMDVLELSDLVIAGMAVLTPLITDLLTAFNATGKKKDAVTFLVSLIFAGIILWQVKGIDLSEATTLGNAWLLIKWLAYYSVIIFGAGHLAWRTIWQVGNTSAKVNAGINPEGIL